MPRIRFRLRELGIRELCQSRPAPLIRPLALHKIPPLTNLLSRTSSLPFVLPRVYFNPGSESTPSPIEAMSFYAVKAGRIPGIYDTWDMCKSMVDGFSGAKYKKFRTKEEAAAFVGVPTVGAASAAPSLSPTRPAPSRAKTALATKRKRSEEDPGDDCIITRHVLPMPKSRRVEPRKPDVVAGMIRDTTGATTATPSPATGSTLVIYTDGAAAGNGRAGCRAGVGVYFGPSDPRNVSEPLPGLRQTNQRAELMAILRALEQCATDQDVEIRTDSRYSMNCLTTWISGWKRRKWINSSGKDVENRDLIEAAHRLMTQRSGRVQFTHVRGHSGEPGNEMADRLAVAGARK
ncbi:hypothetical protein IWQ60_010637 [Tieghemiomyces parasiticus]|uniref:Ribonuclease H n=1 Tax=Tieghemiomyces parasiticus TaxID=78921 RepID=A0A9W7ZL62_9FUNG|nr:hypothetical protein IWQ60_010637 [Tieghemiomyces parasiticus]